MHTELLCCELGTLEGDLHLGGTLKTIDKSLIKGNVILSPTAELVFTCTPDGCPLLTVNGDIALDGLLSTSSFSAASIELVDVQGSLSGKFALSYAGG